MSLFSRDSLVSLGSGLFSQYTGYSLTPAGTAPVQATLPATRTGTPAQDPLSGPGSNGVGTGSKYGSGLFSGGVNPILIVVGSIVVVAAIVMIARR